MKDGRKMKVKNKRSPVDTPKSRAELILRNLKPRKKLEIIPEMAKKMYKNCLIT